VTFLNWAILAGLAGVSIPIIIHLLNKRKAVVVNWGAMRFLRDSVVTRRRRVLVEDVILLALRCLLVALLVLAMARPFIPAGSSLPWAIMLPLLLIAVVDLAVGTALWSNRQLRWWLYGAAGGLLLLVLLVAGLERWLQLSRWTGGGQQDLAIVIDASASMSVRVDGRRNFDRAIEQARTLLTSLDPHDAVAIVLAGPSPNLAIQTPTTTRGDIESALDNAQTTGGRLALVDALGAAADALERGNHAAKKIVLLTDGQDLGWDAAEAHRWQTLARKFEQMPVSPKIICHMLELPMGYRNVGVRRIRTTRAVIGTDRSVGLEAELVNTGIAPIEPQTVQLTIGTQTLTADAVGQISPGATRTVRFDHHFTQPGAWPISVRAVTGDDLAADDQSHRVLRVHQAIEVLLVDGAPSPLPLRSASDYLQLALSPAAQQARAGEDLIRPTVISAADLDESVNLADFSAVALVNVPRLPGDMAKALAGYVQQGGGLLIAPADRADPRFYNNWLADEGQPMTPARLSDRKVADDSQSIAPDTDSFSHPALKLIAEPENSDIARALYSAYWQLAVDPARGTSRVAGRLNNGDPLLVDHRLGKGQVAMLSTAMDRRGSTLPSLHCFVPMVHELIYDLAWSGGVRLSFDRPGAAVAWLGAAGGAVDSRQGLRGDYYSGRSFDRFVGSRMDRQVDFNWNSQPYPKLANDNFSVRWTGSVVPPQSGRYEISTFADDGVRLWLDGKKVIDDWTVGSRRENRARVELEAGRRHDLRIEYYEQSGSAVMELHWKPPGQRQSVIPAMALSPARPTDQWIAEGGAPQVTGPTGQPLPATLETDEQTIAIRIEQVDQPGIYQLVLPSGMESNYQSLINEQGTIPLAVGADLQESQLQPLPQVALAGVSDLVDLYNVESADQVVTAAVGGIPGQELWRYLAVGALIVLLGESLLARWITASRKTGSAQPVDFRGQAAMLGAFRDRARELFTHARAG
jgi:hypothetical protein